MLFNFTGEIIQNSYIDKNNRYITDIHPKGKGTIYYFKQKNQSTIFNQKIKLVGTFKDNNTLEDGVHEIFFSHVLWLAEYKNNVLDETKGVLKFENNAVFSGEFNYDSSNNIFDLIKGVFKENDERILQGTFYNGNLSGLSIYFEPDSYRKSNNNSIEYVPEIKPISVLNCGAIKKKEKNKNKEKNFFDYYSTNNSNNNTKNEYFNYNTNNDTKSNYETYCSINKSKLSEMSKSQTTYSKITKSSYNINSSKTMLYSTYNETSISSTINSNTYYGYSYLYENADKITSKFLLLEEKELSPSNSIVSLAKIQSNNDSKNGNSKICSPSKAKTKEVENSNNIPEQIDIKDLEENLIWGKGIYYKSTFVQGRLHDEGIILTDKKTISVLWRHGKTIKIEERIRSSKKIPIKVLEFLSLTDLNVLLQIKHKSIHEFFTIKEVKKLLQIRMLQLYLLDINQDYEEFISKHRIVNNSMSDFDNIINNNISFLNMINEAKIERIIDMTPQFSKLFINTTGISNNSIYEFNFSIKNLNELFYLSYTGKQVFLPLTPFRTDAGSVSKTMHYSNICYPDKTRSYYSNFYTTKKNDVEIACFVDNEFLNCEIDSGFYSFTVNNNNDYEAYNTIHTNTNIDSKVNEINTNKPISISKYLCRDKVFFTTRKAILEETDKIVEKINSKFTENTSTNNNYNNNFIINTLLNFNYFYIHKKLSFDYDLNHLLHNNENVNTTLLHYKKQATIDIEHRKKELYEKYFNQIKQEIQKLSESEGSYYLKNKKYQYDYDSALLDNYTSVANSKSVNPKIIFSFSTLYFNNSIKPRDFVIMHNPVKTVAVFTSNIKAEYNNNSSVEDLICNKKLSPLNFEETSQYLIKNGYEIMKKESNSNYWMIEVDSSNQNIKNDEKKLICVVRFNTQQEHYLRLKDFHHFGRFVYLKLIDQNALKGFQINTIDLISFMCFGKVIELN